MPSDTIPLVVVHSSHHSIITFPPTTLAQLGIDILNALRKKDDPNSGADISPDARIKHLVVHWAPLGVPNNMDPRIFPNKTVLWNENLQGLFMMLKKRGGNDCVEVVLEEQMERGLSEKNVGSMKMLVI